MKRNVYLLLIFFISIIIGIENISAVSASDYRVGKFIYYDPVNNKTCTSNNYWTVYNQNTTCYRWAVIKTYADIGVIRIMIDHDIGLSNFEDRVEVFEDAIEAWDIPPLSEEQKEYLGIASSSNGNGIGNLGTNMVMKLSEGNHPDLSGDRYELNSKWVSKSPFEFAYYIKKAPNLIKFISSNIQFYKNGTLLYNYNSFGNNSYLFSDIKTDNKEGYWLSDTIKEHPKDIGNYVFYMDAEGNMALSSENDIRGVRPTVYIDIQTLNNALYYDPVISLKNNLVVDGSKVNLVIDSANNQNLNNNTYYYPQGFTTIGNNKHMFYLAPHKVVSEETDPGIMLYIDGSNKTFKKVFTRKYGHGNALAFNSKDSLLYVTPRLSNDGKKYYILKSNVSFFGDTITITDSGVGNDDTALHGIYDFHSDNCAFWTTIVNPDGTTSLKCLEAGTLAVNEDASKIFQITNQTIYIRNKNGKKLYTIDIPEYSGTLQNLTYLDGYIYVAVYEGCVKEYQNYCYGKEHSLSIYVYNAKFNPDGTPNRWFGHRVDSYYSYDINDTENTYEIEGLGAFNDTLYIGLVKKTKINNVLKYAPVIYKYNPTFYTVNYILGNNSYTEKVYENRFVDMGLTLNNKTYDNGFIGWKGPDGTIYTNPEGISLRINENTNLNGVYIDLPKNYTFDNNNIKISKQVAIGDLLNEIKAYNSEIKVKRNNQVITDTNQYVQYNDTLVVSNGTTELKSYNLMPTKVLIKYKDGTTEYDSESNINNSVELKSDINKTGYTLVGWKDLKDNKIYKISEKYAVTTSDVILESVWEANKYTVIYNANSGTGSMENSVFTYDVQGKLSKNTFTKTGYKFKGWSTSSSGVTVFQDEQSIKNLTTQGIITLYASWEALNEVNIDEVISNKYLIKDKKIYNIPKKTGVNNLILGLNNNYSYKIYDEINTNILTEGYIGTGNLLKVYMNGTLKKEYRIIIKGDITGEGEIEVNDVARLYQYIRGKIEMADYYKEAANVEITDSSLAVNDVAKLYQYIRGKIPSL